MTRRSSFSCCANNLRTRKTTDSTWLDTHETQLEHNHQPDPHPGPPERCWYGRLGYTAEEVRMVKAVAAKTAKSEITENTVNL
jgi:hypothetical protein